MEIAMIYHLQLGVPAMEKDDSLKREPKTEPRGQLEILARQPNKLEVKELVKIVNRYWKWVAWETEITGDGFGGVQGVLLYKTFVFSHQKLQGIFTILMESTRHEIERFLSSF
ncbi:hypothetical protein ACOSP7_016518 [Xanthoceras sorbifolium]